MKSYLILFLSLILIFFIYILNIAQWEVPEGMTQSEIPEEILQAHKATWKLELFTVVGSETNLVQGTAFFIGHNQVVTTFSMISTGSNESNKIRSIKHIYLKQGDKEITFNKVLYVSALHDLVILETKETVSEYLSMSKKYPSGSLFALGYSDGVKQTSIHSEEYKMIDNGYDYEMAMNQFELKGLGGGPVLNGKKEVIGIAYRTSSNLLYVKKVSQLEELRRAEIGIDCLKLSLSLLSCIEKEIQNLKEKATQKDPLAQFVLADMYNNGEGVKQDKEKAFYWMEKAANQDFALAQARYATMYIKGEGVKQDKEKAFYWMEKAARQGFVVAQEILALMYKGIGVEKNDKKAFYWMEKAAELGLAISQQQVARMYLDGTGVKKDDKKAFYWMLKAAEQGYDLAQQRVALMYLDGTGVKKDDKKAFYWMLTAAELGVKKDDKKAFYWMLKAAEQVFYWMLEAAKKKNAAAEKDVVIMYNKGIGVTEDNKEAFLKWRSEKELHTK